MYIGTDYEHNPNFFVYVDFLQDYEDICLSDGS